MQYSDSAQVPQERPTQGPKSRLAVRRGPWVPRWVAQAHNGDWVEAGTLSQRSGGRRRGEMIAYHDRTHLDDLRTSEVQG
jgi:hypothetical protein